MAPNSAVLIAALSLAIPVHAQGFKPTRPVEVVVHTGPGGGSDVLARAVVTMLEREKLVSQTPVKKPIVCCSPAFSAR